MFIQLLRERILLFIVFITGAAVLVLEVAATRILASYFGNTIFTVSSAISVILLALSIGYYIGGRLADQRGSERMLHLLITLGGISVYILDLLNMFVVPWLSRYLSLQYGPMIVSLLLFFLPGFLLGTLSPLVAKLQKARLQKEGIGKITGDVFFWSTLGSIIGSLVTGFYLIPTFGVNQIIMGTGVVLFTMGVLGLMSQQMDSVLKKKLMILLFFLPLAFSFLIIRNEPHKNVVYAKDGVYGDIVIFDNYFAGKPARFLRQDRDASSAMFHESPELVYNYTKYYAVYQLINSDIQHALVIGGGAYSVPKALLEHDADVIVDVAEIEPELFALGKKYFRVPENARLRNHVEDGRRFLQQTETIYDVIFTDAFHTSIPAHLTTKEFFQLSKNKLSPNGMYIMNLVGSLSGTKPSFIFSEIKTFRSVYPNSYFFAARDISLPDIQSVIMVGYNGNEKIDFASLVQKTDNAFLQAIPAHQIPVEQYDFTDHPVFTDNYAPVEYFILNEFR